jgi:signal transduction histidine kinase
MNRAQKKFSRRLRWLLILPVLVATAAHVLLSTLRVQGLLRARGSEEARSLAESVAREQVGLALLEGLGLAFALGLVASWVARRLGSELGAVIDATDRIAAQELGTRVPAQSLLGLERVPEAFNAMAERLEASQRALNRADATAAEFGDRVRQAQALAAVGQVAATIAHEVGSPLNTILITTRMAAEDPSCPAAQRETFDRIGAQTERIGTILRRMLKLAQPPSDERGACDVGESVREIVGFMSSELRRANIECRILLPDRRVTAAIRGDHLQQALFNLLVNATHEQPRGGRIDVHACEADGGVRIDVTDDGPGLREQDRAHLWEPFYSGRRAAGDPHATGLGLAVVKHLIERVGGTVAATNADEGGARFSLWLPLA